MQSRVAELTRERDALLAQSNLLGSFSRLPQADSRAHNIFSITDVHCDSFTNEEVVVECSFLDTQFRVHIEKRGTTVQRLQIDPIGGSMNIEIAAFTQRLIARATEVANPTMFLINMAKLERQHKLYRRLLDGLYERLKACGDVQLVNGAGSILMNSHAVDLMFVPQQPTQLYVDGQNLSHLCDTANVDKLELFLKTVAAA